MNTRLTYRSIAEWGAGLLLICSLAYQFIQGYQFTAKLKVSLVLLLISLGLGFLDTGLGKKMLAIVLVLGVFDVLDFFAATFSLGFGFKYLVLRIDFILMAVLGLHLLLNRKFFYALGSRFLNRERSDEEIEQADRQHVIAFKKNFNTKSREELEKICANDKLLPHVRQAARELLDGIKVED